MLILKLLLLSLFVAAWIYSRRGTSQLTITDVFVATLLTILVPYFLFNPAASSQWTPLTFPPDTILRSEIGIMMMLATGCTVLLLRGRVTPAGRRASEPMSRLTVPRGIIGSALLISVSVFLVLCFYPPFLRFRFLTLEFLFGNLDATEYQIARRVGFADDTLIADVLSRLRFSIFPVLYILVFAGLWSMRQRAAALISAAAIFLLLSMSFAKLPILYYIGYGALFALAGRSRVMNVSKITGLVTLATISVLMLMSILYTIQYSSISGFSVFYDRPLSLAVERVWGESYSAILRYFHVYPERLSYAGVSSISMLASTLGIEYRNVDLEVPYYFFGRGVLTSNPAMFVAGGYASFGYVGIIVYSAVSFVLVTILDRFHGRIRNPFLARCYFAVVGVNVTFLAQVALPTTLLTYGLAVVPVTFLLVDRWLSGRAVHPRSGAPTLRPER